jgi:hypothetical protein
MLAALQVLRSSCDASRRNVALSGIRRMSDAATAAEALRPRRVISRRAWQAHERTMPKKPKIKSTRADEKPWPRNMQLAAYAAGAVFVPYSTVWLISSNPTLRELFKDILPMDTIRGHFGEMEWDAQSYQDKLSGEAPDRGYSRLPEEMPLAERRKQAKIEELNSAQVTVNVYLLDSSSSQTTIRSPGSVPANPEKLLELLGSQVEHAKGSVAIDFEEDQDNNYSSNASDLYADDVNQDFTLEDPTKDLLRQTHTFSTWYYQRPVQEEQQVGKVTDRDMEISRLEYTIDKLQKDRKDPASTRDMDDMAEELQQAKSSLSKLRWKRRLGM